MGLLRAYRATGADLPFGNQLAAHGVAMEGYFWRLTDAASGRVVIALIGVNRSPTGNWATLGLAAHPGGFLATAAHDGAVASRHRLEVAAGSAFEASAEAVHVDLGPRARLDLRITDPAPWPSRALGGSSYFQLLPALSQYWHPWLLGGRAHGTAVLGSQRWDFAGAQIYGEKNWGREGFPDRWWWGQAQGFAAPQALVAFAGGELIAGRVRGEISVLVVRLPDGWVVRLGDPLVSPVRARVEPQRWRLRGAGRGWEVDLAGRAPLGDAHVLPVPLPSQRRNTAGSLEHLAGTLHVRVRYRGREVWRDTSRLAALEHGGLATAAAELRRRVGNGAGPEVAAAR